LEGADSGSPHPLYVSLPRGACRGWRARGADEDDRPGWGRIAEVSTPVGGSSSCRARCAVRECSAGPDVNGMPLPRTDP